MQRVLSGSQTGSSSACTGSAHTHKASPARRCCCPVQAAGGRPANFGSDRASFGNSSGLILPGESGSRPARGTGRLIIPGASYLDLHVSRCPSCTSDKLISRTCHRPGWSAVGFQERSFPTTSWFHGRRQRAEQRAEYRIAAGTNFRRVRLTSQVRLTHHDAQRLLGSAGHARQAAGSVRVLV